MNDLGPNDKGWRRFFVRNAGQEAGAKDPKQIKSITRKGKS
jgi:hypothetical protein